MFKLFPAVVAFLASAASIHAQDSSIYEIAESNTDFETLTAALELTDLDDVLDCTNPFTCRFTVFAPTDTAFENLPADLLAKLLTEDWKAHLTRILLYHVLPGYTDSSELEDGKKIHTLAGDFVNTTIEADGTVKINDATILTADIEAKNGFVHVIDQVLIPSFMTKDIIATARDTGIFETLLAAVDAAGLTATLQGPGPFTLFAPTDNAFDNLPEGQVAALLNDIPTLTDILTYHVIQDSIVLASELEDAPLVTIQGETIDVSVHSYWLFSFTYLNNDVTITGSDILTSNGVIHIINEVLIPDSATPPEPTIAEVVAADSNLDTLEAALGVASTVFEGDGPFTVFAPSDEAFGDLPEDLLNGLLDDPDALAEILKYHVVAGEVKRKDLEDGALKTSNGADIIVDRGFFRTILNDDSRIEEFNIEAGNGVVHIIDKVLIPPSNCLAVAESMGLTSFVNAVDTAGLRDALTDPTSSLTIFAPNNKAFSALDGVTIAPADLATILTYHVLDTVVASSDLSDGSSVATLEGSDIEIDFEYFFFIFFLGAYLNDSAKIVETDINCAGGIIHVIDEILTIP